MTLLTTGPPVAQTPVRLISIVMFHSWRFLAQRGGRTKIESPSAEVVRVKTLARNGDFSAWFNFVDS